MLSDKIKAQVLNQLLEGKNVKFELNILRNGFVSQDIILVVIRYLTFVTN